MNNTTLTDQIRTLMIESDEKVVKTADLHLYLTLSTREEKAKVYSVMRDFVRKGEVERVSKGEYRYIGKEEVRTLSKKLWMYLRARKKVTYDEFIEMTGASLEYVQEWCRKLEKREIVRIERDKHQDNKGRLKGGRRDKKGRFTDFEETKVILLYDPVILPVLDETSIKMKQIREKKKKQALSALAEAKKAITQAEIILGDR